MLTRQQLDSYRDGLFFIVGNSRAGTTLLQTMLSSSSTITIPPETHYFANLHVLERKFGPRVTPDNLVPLVTFLLRPAGRMVDLDVERDEIVELFRNYGSSYHDLFLMFMAAHAAKRHKRRCGEKTPRHLLHVTQLARAFPRSKFVALFRDPRSIAASELRADFGSPSVYVTSRRWAAYADVHERLKAEMPEDRYIKVHYEKLVTDPQATLEEICRFLAEEYSPSMLEFHRRPSGETGYPAHEESWKKNTRSPLSSERIDAWRDELSPSQIEIIERTTGHRLGDMGYAASGREKVGALRLYGSWLIDLTSSLVADLTRARKTKRS